MITLTHRRSARIVPTMDRVGGRWSDSFPPRIIRRAERALPSVAMLCLTAFVPLVGCSSKDSNHVATSSRTDVLPNEVYPAVVIAGPGNAWVVEDAPTTSATARVWRIADNGEIELFAEVPNYDSMSGTFLNDRVVIGGLRCRADVTSEDICPESLLELTTIDPTGADAATVLDSHPGGQGDADAFNIVGRSGSELWVSDFSAQVLRVNAEAKEVGRALQPNGAPCVINDRLFQLTVSEPPPSPAPNSSAASIVPDAVVVQEYVVTEWDGQNWTETNRSRLNYSGSYSLGSCTSEGFEVSSPELRYTWSWQEGWKQTPIIDRVATALSEATSSNGATYTLDLQGTVTKEVGPAIEPTTISFGASSSETELPPGLFVDDFGKTVAACIFRPDQPAQCDVGRTG